MPGTVETPWIAELKITNDSAPWIRNVQTNENTGNKNTDDKP